MDDSGILFSFGEGMARITLNRPARLNSFADAMHEPQADRLMQSRRLASWSVAGAVPAITPGSAARPAPEGHGP